jgi:hypothetical protein
VRYSLGKHKSFLALLGNPVVLQVSCILLGEPFILCWEDLMVKEAGEPFGVPWHQDAESGGPGVYTIGAYITGSGDNPLRVIPGSHRQGVLSPRALHAFLAEHESEAVRVEANAGDLVIHDINAVHESGKCGSHTRYTLFFEFRNRRMVQDMPSWGQTFLNARRHFVSAGVAERRSFAELVREDEQRGLVSAPFPEYWSTEDEVPPSEPIDFRVPQSPDRWCTAPTADQERSAVEAFVAEQDIVLVSTRFGVSEEALFKWLCKAGVVRPGTNGRYSDEPRSDAVVVE